MSNSSVPFTIVRHTCSFPFIAVFGLLALCLFVTDSAHAQDTTSGIEGRVVFDDGSPVVGATINVRHGATNLRRSTTTNESGVFRVPKLRVGGPYDVVLASTSDYRGERTEGIYIELGEAFELQLVVERTGVEEIVVTASVADAFAQAGAGTRFDQENIQGMANVNRDFKNIIRQDPRVLIDPANSNAVSIAGSNNRFNSLTVDGLRQNDDFGLNNNGFPTQRSPVSIDAIEQVVVSISPFDVSYGGFTGGTINAVTKSGTNDWDGSISIFHSNEGLVGDKTEDNDISLGKFDEDTMAFTLSGPIIKDKLWFFAAYDEYTTTDTSALSFGPAGSGRANEVAGVTQTDIDNVLEVASRVYGIDAGALPDSGTDIEDKKLLLKLDWSINDNHDVVATYQDVIGNDLNPQGSSVGSNRLGLTSNWYDKEEEMESVSAQLFSRWTDSFSSEIKFAVKKVKTGQNSLGGTDYAQMTINTPNGGAIRIGPDIFRHANRLSNENSQLKLKGEWLLGMHTISFGYERDDLDVFNLFVRASEGDYNFDCIYTADCANSLEAGNAAQLNEYNNAFTNQETDAAANFSFSINSLYVQDEWDVSDRLSLTYGLRYDWYTGSDRPAENAGFAQRNGFSNTENLDGRDVIMPRLGIRYDLDDRTTLRGGLGLFSGGSPNVWISNSFTNDGVTIVSPDNTGAIDPLCAGVTSPGSAALTGIDPFNIDPAVQACMFQGAGDVEATAPDFEIPSTWRLNLAAERYFDLGVLGDDWLLSAEAVLSHVKEATEWRELRRTQIGTAPDGRPIYDAPPNYDVILTNVDDGYANTFSLSMSNEMNTAMGDWSMFFAYTYMDAEDVNPAQSSTVSSNYGRPATLDRNNRRPSISDFEIEHRFNGNIGWQKRLFGDNLTRVSAFFEVRSGKRFSYTMRERPFDTAVWGGDSTFARRDSQLLYVPLEGDPNVIFSETPGDLVNDSALEADFNAFVAGAGLEAYRGQILPRNHDTTSGRSRIDLRISQEIGLTRIPGLGESKLELFFDIENLGNLLNNDWGRVEQVNFPFNFVAVGEVSLNSNGQYVYGSFGSGFSGGLQPASLQNGGLPSLYKIQLGARLGF